MINIIIFVQIVFLFVTAKIIVQDVSISVSALAIVIWGLLAGILFKIIGFWVMLPTTIILIYLVQKCIMNLKVAIVVSVESAILMVLVDHITQIIVRLLVRPTDYLVAFILIQLSVNAVLYLIYDRSSWQIKYDQITYSELGLVLGTLLIIYGYIVFVESNTTDLYYIVFDLLFFVLFGLANVLVQVEHAKRIRNESKLRYEHDLLISSERYVVEIEKHYNEMRRFRHDYQNVILSMDEYMQTGDMAGLTRYYQENLKPISAKLTREKYVLENMTYIQNKELKSILFNKLNYAQSLNIKVSFDCRTLIKDLGTDTFQLVIALGLILDNAIEATTTQMHGQILVGIFKQSANLIILVQNSLAVDVSLPPIWRLKQQGFSTKGTQRGLGLSQLSAIIDQDACLTLETQLEPQFFLQKITIRLGESE